MEIKRVFNQPEDYGREWEGNCENLPLNNPTSDEQREIRHAWLTREVRSVLDDEQVESTVADIETLLNIKWVTMDDVSRAIENFRKVNEGE